MLFAADAKRLPEIASPMGLSRPKCIQTPCPARNITSASLIGVTINEHQDAQESLADSMYDLRSGSSPELPAGSSPLDSCCGSELRSRWDMMTMLRGNSFEMDGTLLLEITHDNHPSASMDGNPANSRSIFLCLKN